GRYTITVSKPGFVATSHLVDLPEGGVEAAEFVLLLEPVLASITITESAGYLTSQTSTATRTPTPLRDVPQSITIISREQINDQMMMSIGDVVRYVPGISSHQGENNRDQLVIRGNNTSADFFVNGMRDDVQYYRDLYN